MRQILITGATGTLGRAFARICDSRGLPYRLTTRADLDIADQESVRSVLANPDIWAVINTAGYVRVDDAEREPDRCRRENSDGPATLAAVCAERGLPFVTFSSDLVFDGRQTTPYIEDDPVGPLNVYGQTKAEAEERVLAAWPKALVIRTSAFFGPWDEYNFVTIALRELAAGRPFVAATDSVISPTYVPDLVHSSLDLLLDREHGVWHLANDGPVSWHDLARMAAAMAGADPDRIEGRPVASFGWAAARPSYSVLGTGRGRSLPSLDDALSRYFHQRPAPVGS
jgi:dTDP-4-dehydrorhamnose reductase